MRHSLFAGIGVAAMVLFAACSPDQSRQEPLAPADVGLAKGGGGGGSLTCANSVAKDIDILEAALFTPEQIATLDALFTTIKRECPTSSPSVALLTYIQRVIDFRPDVAPPSNPPPGPGTPAPEIDDTRAQNLVALWNLVTTYATSADPLVRSPSVLKTGTLVAGQEGTRGGGADVLDGTDLEMTTFDRQAGVKISNPQGSTPPNPAGAYLITMELSGTGCPMTTLRPATNAQGARPCYEVKSYPAVSAWNPKVSVGMCIHRGNNPAAITHGNSNFGTEVLPPGAAFPWNSAYSCTVTHTMLDTWLGREAGPFGRALARAIDYLRPQPLLADDAGESGLGLFFSPFGGALTVVFDDQFDDDSPGPFVDGTNPVVGDISGGTFDSWDVFFPHPGSATIQNGFGDMTGNVIVLSQALGNCSQCPTTYLLGSRVNPDANDNLGTYEITWTSLQNKSSAKEAPFVVRAFSGEEIARLSYVSEMNNLRFRYNGATVNFSTSPNVPLTWTVDVHHDFKITVNLQTVSGQNSYKTSLAVRLDANGQPCSGAAPACDYRTLVSNVKFLNAVGQGPNAIPGTTAGKTVTTIGYYLSGIDAGIIVADNFRMRRLPDSP